jgi:osmotically-inducible protein OsmY
MSSMPPATRWRQVVVLAALGAALAGAGCTTDSGSQRSAGTVVDDAVITSEVKSSFIADPTVKALAIDVDTDQGVVTLSGTVKSKAEMDRAVSLAKNRKGVRSVRNNLRLDSAG